jgi:hypothetical protein
MLEPQDVRHAIKREGAINIHNQQVEALWRLWSAYTRGLAHNPALLKINSELAGIKRGSRGGAFASGRSLRE